MPPNEAAYEDRDEERRRQDDYLLVRMASDVAHWWNRRSGHLAKTVTVLSFVTTIGGGIAAGLVAFGTVKANFSGIPARADTLETRQRQLQDTVSDSWDAVERNRSRISSLESRVNDLQSSIGELRSSINELRDIVQANNCWIRVAANEESRFNCSATPSQGDG